MIDEKLMELNTPCYIYNEKVLRNRIEYVKTSLGQDVSLCFSMKANPIILKYIRNYVDRIEVCSHGEFKICKLYGIEPNKIFYTGVNKQKEEVEEAVNYGVSFFNAESEQQLKIITKTATKNKKKLNVQIRISSGNQFGSDINEISAMINKFQNYEYLDITGLHYFAGTSIKSKKRSRQLEFLKESIAKLRNLIKHETVEIEYGPGLPTRLFLDEEDNLSEISMSEFIPELKKIINYDEKWTIEMGRYLVADCGNYMTSVADKKQVDGINYIISDGGINHLNYYGQTMSLRVPIIESSVSNDKEKYKYWICGSLCTTADVLVKNVLLPKLEIGDRLLFKNCGAYSNTEANYLFLSRDFPNVYLKKENENFILIKNKKQSYDINMGDI